MDSGQPCNCGHCSVCDDEGYRRRQFEQLQKDAWRISQNEELLEQERIRAEKFRDLVIEEEKGGYISNIGLRGGDRYYMALNFKREEEFYKEHGRYQTIWEFLGSVFPNQNKE